MLEASSSVWHKSLTKENESDLEQVQKSAFRLILGNDYISYENAQNVLQMESLFDRRERLFTNFTLKSLHVKQMKHILKLKQNKNPAYGRQSISQPMRIVAPIPQ